jgi:cytochrome b561
MLAGGGEGAWMAAESYGGVAKWFHWVTVGLMAVALPMGFVIKHVKDSDKMPFYAVHESAGLTILLVAVARLAWRWTHPPPPLPDHVPAPMRLAAAANHWLLYAAMIAQPVLGFVATNAWGFPLRGQTAYLGFIHLPKFMEQNVPLAEAVQAAHNALGIAIAVLLAIHIGAAVFHQAIRRDGILLRMV